MDEAILGRHRIQSLLIGRLIDGADESLTVRRPRGTNHREGVDPAELTEQEALAGAIGIREQEIHAALLRNTPQESEALAVGRETDAGVNVANDLRGRATEDGHSVERTEKVVFLAGSG